MSSAVASNDFPLAASIFISGSNELLRLRSNSSAPLNTDITMMSAAVIMETTAIEMIEIILMKFFLRVENRYRLAIKYGSFKTIGKLLRRIFSGRYVQTF